MVARDPRCSDDPARVTARRLFEAWRRILGRFATCRHARLGRAADSTTQDSAGPIGSTAHRAADDRLLIGAGVTLLVVGAVARVFLAPEGARMTESVAGSMTVALAFARLAILALSLPRPAANHRRSLWRVWASGLAPYVTAIGPYTSMVAWAVSAGLTLSLLQRGGVPEARARRAVFLAWGVHAAIGAAAWLVRNAAVAVLTL